MADLMSTSLSGMLAFQRALEMTGNNIANANTPGYSRQVAQFTARAGFGIYSIGGGTSISSIKRIYDNLLGEQFRTSLTGYARLSTLDNLAGRIDGLLANADTGLNAGLQSFFNSVQDVANDPASITARQALIGEADSIASRFLSLNQRLDDIDSEVSGRVSLAVSDINELANAIADINDQIARSSGVDGQLPNELLDQRDSLVRQLSEQVTVSTTLQDDGAMNVFIGSGQTLVVGINANQLAVRGSEFDPTRLTVVYQGSAGSTPIDTALSGGNLGGLLEFRSRMLDPARQSLGQTAIAFASRFNEQHSSGMDLRGSLGGDFFSVDPPGILYSSDNTGSGSAVAAVSDVGNLTGRDYILEYDGASYSLIRADTQQPIPLSGSGTAGDPFVADGINFTVAGAPNAGDRIMIQSGQGAASSIQNLMSDSQSIALAAPTRFEASLSNLGNASISSATVVDSSDPGLLTTSQIEFTSPTTYTINGAGSFAYTAGDPIVINGSSVTIDGAPATGDRFIIESNSGASGDNSNGRLLADIQSVGVLDRGTIGIVESYGRLISSVGGTTRQVQVNLDAQSVVLTNAQNAVLSSSGVNLDEEAANLIRFQQSYQAAAQVFSIASALFDSLLNATRR